MCPARVSSGKCCVSETRELSALTVRKEPARFGILGHHRNPGAVDWALHRAPLPNCYMENQTSILRLAVALAIPLLFSCDKGHDVPRGDITKVTIDLNKIAPIG